MTPEMERWAEALAVDRQHGGKASDYVASRVRELAMRVDDKGVARWLDIPDRLDALAPGGTV